MEHHVSFDNFINSMLKYINPIINRPTKISSSFNYINFISPVNISEKNVPYYSISSLIPAFLILGSSPPINDDINLVDSSELENIYNSKLGEYGIITFYNPIVGRDTFLIKCHKTDIIKDVIKSLIIDLFLTMLELSTYQKYDTHITNIVNNLELIIINSDVIDAVPISDNLKVSQVTTTLDDKVISSNLKIPINLKLLFITFIPVDISTVPMEDHIQRNIIYIINNFLFSDI